MNNQFEHKCQIEKKYEQAQWTEIWTISSKEKWTTILNKFMNNQFEQEYQFQQNYQETIWTKIATIK